MPKKKTAPPPNETKREKFVRLAEKRVSAAILKIVGVGNLANKAAYEFSNTDLIDIGNALGKAISDVSAKFENACNEAPDAPENTFKLGQVEEKTDG